MSYWTGIVKRAAYVAKSNINQKSEEKLNSNILKKRNLSRCTVNFSEVKIDQNFCFGKLEYEFKKINTHEAIYLDGCDVNLPHSFSPSTLVQIVEAERLNTLESFLFDNKTSLSLSESSTNMIEESFSNEVEKLYKELEESSLRVSLELENLKKEFIDMKNQNH
jgi:hypothetical protein